MMAKKIDKPNKPARRRPSVSRSKSTLQESEGDVGGVARAGRPAPDFEAMAFVKGRFKKIRLSDCMGKWVALIFYPGDFTFVCPTELAALALKSKEFRSLGVKVLVISTDSPYVHRVWQEQELSKMVPGGLPFPMLSDAGGRIGRAYGVYDEGAGVDVRGRFLIDPEGVIQAVEVLTPPVGRNVMELIRQIRAFQHVRKTSEVTPSGWQPGRRGLKPSPDLAGKVGKVWKPGKAL